MKISLILLILIKIQLINARHVYKWPYGLDKRYNKNCTEIHRQRFNECEYRHWIKWNMEIKYLNIDSHKFCCFLWQTTDCEVNVAKECNLTYAKLFILNTFKQFRFICERFPYKNHFYDCKDPDYRRTKLIIWAVVTFTISAMVFVAFSPASSIAVTAALQFFGAFLFGTGDIYEEPLI